MKETAAGCAAQQRGFRVRRTRAVRASKLAHHFMLVMPLSGAMLQSLACSDEPPRSRIGRLHCGIPRRLAGVPGRIVEPHLHRAGVVA